MAKPVDFSVTNRISGMNKIDESYVNDTDVTLTKDEAGSVQAYEFGQGYKKGYKKGVYDGSVIGCLGSAAMSIGVGLILWFTKPKY